MRLMSFRTCLTGLLLLLPIALLSGVVTGPVTLAPSDIWQLYTSSPGEADRLSPLTMAQEKLIIEVIRLPRVCLAVIVGGLLATCGALLQGLFRNPLADPTLIGVSAGASVGAGSMIVFGSLWATAAGWLPGISIQVLGAFLGALLTALLVFRLATSVRGTSVTTMLLAGIAVSALAGAINSLLSFFADNDMLRRISLWQMGNLDGANWTQVNYCLGVSVLLGLLIPKELQSLNAMLLGESEAQHLGVNVEHLKRKLIFYSALGVAVSVAVAGVIAFVGLMVPHWIRMLIGPDHRGLVPASAVAGAILLVFADTLARVVVAPAELPVGVVTALLGTPFFIWLLIKQRRRNES